MNDTSRPQNLSAIGVVFWLLNAVHNILSARQLDSEFVWDGLLPTTTF